MNMSPADWIAIGSVVINLIVMVVAANINAKISQMKVDMYETFLTKDDYFQFQERRTFSGNGNRRKT